MSRLPKPGEGSWTVHYGLGTEPVSYEGAVSREYYELEKEAAFRRSWLHVGRVDQIHKPGHYFAKEIAILDTSIAVVRDTDGKVRAFHDICRHRGNKLVSNDFPKEEQAVHAASSCASSTAGATTSTARSTSRNKRTSSSIWIKASSASNRCTATCGRASSSSISPTSRRRRCPSIWVRCSPPWTGTPSTS